MLRLLPSYRACIRAPPPPPPIWDHTGATYPTLQAERKKNQIQTYWSTEKRVISWARQENKPWHRESLLKYYTIYGFACLSHWMEEDRFKREKNDRNQRYESINEGEHTNKTWKKALGMARKEYKLGYKPVVTEEGKLISPEGPGAKTSQARLECGLGDRQKRNVNCN